MDVNRTLLKKLLAPALIIIIGGALGLVLRYHQVAPIGSPVFSGIPYEFDAYRGYEERFSAETYDILRADTTTLRRYQDEHGNNYWLFIAYFSDQKYGSQIHSPKHCLPGGGWRIESTADISLGQSSDAGATEMIISREEQKQVMLYWFETRSGSIQGEFALKFDLVKNALLFKPTDAAFVRLTVLSPNGDLETAHAAGLRFLNQLSGAIHESLPFRS